MVSAVLPRREGIGSEKRAWAHLVGLADCARVTLALIGYEWAELDPVRGLGVEVIHLPAFPKEPVWRGPLRRQLGVLTEVYSYAVLRRFSSFIRHRPDQLREIARLLAAPQDMVVGFKLPAAVSFDHWQAHLPWRPRRRIVDLDDLVSSFFRQRSRHADGTLERVFLQVLSRSRRGSEDRVVREWDRVLLCGEADASQLRGRNPRFADRVGILSNVFDTEAIAPQPPEELASALARAAVEEPFRLLFVGLLNYHPNTDAVLFMAERLRPLLGRARHGIAVTVAGRSAPDAVRQACARAGFRLVENAPDLAPLYREAHAVVAPVRFGSGSRLKILEAWCHGKPLIATTMAMEGMDLATEAHFHRADTPDAIVQAVEDIIAAPERAVAMAVAGRALVEQAYGYAASRTAWKGLIGEDAALPAPPRPGG